MKNFKLLLLLLLFTGCDNQLTPEKKKRIKETRPKISCFGPEGWKDHWSISPDAFWRGGWSFYNLEGEKIESSMCQKVIIYMPKE